jgi:hypothetical protein
VKFWMISAALLLPGSPVQAYADHAATGMGGYVRLLARPDLGGGNGRLGFWNLYGRLLNEGPWVSLDPRMTLLKKSDGAWSDLHLKLEGPGPLGASGGGSLAKMALTQAYLRAGERRGGDWTLRLGSLDTWFGDLGLYDMRPASLFQGSVGAALEGKQGKWSYLLALGDAGFAMLADQYNAVISAGGAMHYRSKRLVVGLGGEYRFEPEVPGKANAPHATPGMKLEDLLRGEVVERFLEGRPGQEDFFPKPEARSNNSFALVGELGFGGFKALRWWQSFARFERLHPERSRIENFAGRDFTLYLADLTNERWRATFGSEAQLVLLPKKLDLWWGFLGIWAWDDDNALAPSDHNMQMFSSVLRAQYYLSNRWHLLGEGSLASETSTNGRRWRASARSIEAGTGGMSDSRGLEFGDLETRITKQIKGGLLFSPKGKGLFARPLIRLLYGLQHSNENNAFGNAFETRESNENTFSPVQRHLHHLIALEAEAWF